MTIKFNRVFAMPNHRTFKIKPIKELLDKYAYNGKTWLDPFANESKIARFANDLNPKFNTDYHLDFREFMQEFEPGSINGILLDPPYSPRQIKEHYDGMGLKMSQEDSHGFYQKAWHEIIRIQPEYVIQFGWMSNGRKEYYKVIEILLVSHGGNHYDTIVSVHKKLNESLGDDFV